MLKALKNSGRESILLEYSDLMRSQDSFDRLEDFVGQRLTDRRDAAFHRNQKVAQKEQKMLAITSKLNRIYGQPDINKIVKLLRNFEES